MDIQEALDYLRAEIAKYNLDDDGMDDDDLIVRALYHLASDVRLEFNELEDQDDDDGGDGLDAYLQSH